METKALYLDGSNTGKLKYGPNPNNDLIEIKKGRYVQHSVSHPLKSENERFFERVFSLEFEGKRIYFLNAFGQKDGNSGTHIALNRFQNQCFLWLQNKHWLQKEENLRYIVNLIFLCIGAYVGIKKL